MESLHRWVRKRNIHWASILFSLQFFLGMLQLLDIFQPTYYPMLHKATRTVKFQLGFSLLIPLGLSLGAWFLWMIYARHRKFFLIPILAFIFYPFIGVSGCLVLASFTAVLIGLTMNRDYMWFLGGNLILLSFIEGLSLIHWLICYPLQLGCPFEAIARIEEGLFYLSGHLVPLLVFPLLFSWILPLFKITWLDGEDVEDPKIIRKDETYNRYILFLLLSVFLGVIAAIFPYNPIINVDNKAVGTDYNDYLSMARIVESNFSQAFAAWHGSRPFTFLFILGIKTVSGLGLNVVVKYLPVILIPLLVISSSFLAHEISRDVKVSAWTGFFTVCSYQVTSGMYAYFLSNYLGLTLVFFSLGFLFRSLRKRSIYSLGISCLMGGLGLFTHPWTISQYLSAVFLTTCYLSYIYITKKNELNNLKILIIYLFSMGFFEIIKSTVFNGLGGIASFETVAKGVSKSFLFWYTSIFSFRLLYGGTMTVFLLFLLSSFGSYFFNNKKSIPILTMIFYTFLNSLMFVIGNEYIKSRLLFNYQIGFFASIGYIHVNNKISTGNKNILQIFVILHMLVYLFRSITNLL